MDTNISPHNVRGLSDDLMGDGVTIQMAMEARRKKLKDLPNDYFELETIPRGRFWDARKADSDEEEQR